MSETDEDATGHARQSRDGSLPAARRRPSATDPIRRKTHRPLPDFTGMTKVSSQAEAGFTDFLPVALQIVSTPPSRGRRLVGYIVCGAITFALAWSIFGDLRLFAVAPGEIEAQGGNQVIEPLEAGQVSATPVQNGSHVGKGGIVLQLDPTAAQALKTIAEAKLADARAEAYRHSTAAFLARTKSTATDPALAWPSRIPADVKSREASVLRADLAQLSATIADLDAKLKTEKATADKLVADISAQKTLIESRTKRTAMHQTLADQGWDSRAIVLQSLEPLRQDQVHLTSYEGQLAEANATLPVIQDEMTAARDSFIAENINAAAKADRDAGVLAEQLNKANLSLANMSLRAPVAGTVQGLAVTSLAQSVKPGDVLMQIAPDATPLDVKAYVLNSDIGFVKVGQPVTIKVDTFPFTRYGTIAGRVVGVGADAVTGNFARMQQSNDATTPSSGTLSVTSATQQMKDLVFPVTVALKSTSIQVDGRQVPLAAGMSVAIEIETARQRAITYLLYPLTRVFRRDGHT